MISAAQSEQSQSQTRCLTWPLWVFLRHSHWRRQEVRRVARWAFVTHEHTRCTQAAGLCTCMLRTVAIVYSYVHMVYIYRAHRAFLCMHTWTHACAILRAAEQTVEWCSAVKCVELLFPLLGSCKSWLRDNCHCHRASWAAVWGNTWKLKFNSYKA